MAAQQRISKRKLDEILGKARKASIFREVSDAALQDPTLWRRFDCRLPAYVTDPRIGPCLVHGQGVELKETENRLLIYPVTIGGSSLENAGGIGRDKWYSVPKTVLSTEITVALDYIIILDALILNAVLQTSAINIGKSTFTLYSVQHSQEQHDTSETLTLTLDELQKEIANGNNDDKRALDVFIQSNPSLTKDMDFMSKHVVSPEADQLIIGDSIETEIVDRWTLAPTFLQRYLRS